MEPPGALDEIPAYVEETAPVVEDQLRRLRGLQRPGEHAEAIDEYLTSAEATLRSARDVAAAAERGLEDEARAAGRRTQRLTGQTRELAEQLGAGECARG